MGKLLPKVDAKSFGGPSEYRVMFGPDFCGHTKRTHVIFNYNGDNLLTKNEPRAETDKKSHLYTLIVKPDNTYEVLIDSGSVKSGSLFDDWDFLEPKEIKDPAKSKPEDWVDEKKIPDPEDKKPRATTTSPRPSPTQRLSNPKIGMSKRMVTGRHHRFLTRSTKASGNKRKLTIPHIRASGSIPGLRTQPLRKTTRCT